MFKAPLRRLLLAALVLLLPAMSAHAEDPPLVRAQNAVRVLNEIMEAPDKSIPSDLLKEAHAIAVIPDMIKAAGPVGRTATASTDSQFKAEIYSYSRSRGLFAGVALDGSALRIDYDANEEIYGKGITPRRIFEGGVSNVPAQVVDFRDRLEEYTQR